MPTCPQNYSQDRIRWQFYSILTKLWPWDWHQHVKSSQMQSHSHTKTWDIGPSIIINALRKCRICQHSMNIFERTTKQISAKKTSENTPGYRKTMWLNSKFTDFSVYWRYDVVWVYYLHLCVSINRKTTVFYFKHLEPGESTAFGLA